MNKSDRICLWKETELTGYPDLNALLGKKSTRKQNWAETFKGCGHLKALSCGGQGEQGQLWPPCANAPTRHGAQTGQGSGEVVGLFPAVSRWFR